MVFGSFMLAHRENRVRLKDELSDAVPRPNDEWVSCIVVEEHHLELILVLWVDEARANSDSVLHGQSNARLNATIGSGRELNSDSCRHNHPLARQNDITIGGKQVVPRRPL